MNLIKKYIRRGIFTSASEGSDYLQHVELRNSKFKLKHASMMMLRFFYTSDPKNLVSLENKHQ